MSRYEVTTRAVRIKLDANEHPYGVVPELRGELQRALGAVDASRYPDASSSGVRALLGRHLGVDADRIVVGSGSNEVMACIATSVRAEVSQVVIPCPTFGMYRVVAGNLDLPVVEVPTDRDFRLEPEAVGRAVSRGSSLVFLCMPNNPTGAYFPHDCVQAALDAGARAVVVDEAYGEFGGSSWVEASGRDPRVIVLRTLSKAFGLAGVRLGYCVAHGEVVGRIDAVRAPYNVGGYSQAAAAVVLERPEVQLASVAPVAESIRDMVRELSGIPGLRPFPSCTNFVLFRVDEGAYGMSATELWEALGDRGISIRRFGGVPELEGHLRVSAGLPEENEEFLAGLRDLGGGER